MAACYPVPFKTCRLAHIPRLSCPYCDCLLCALSRPHCSSFFAIVLANVLPDLARSETPPLDLSTSLDVLRATSIGTHRCVLVLGSFVNCSSFVVPFLSAATHFSFSSALTRMSAECMAHSLFADSSLFWSICALLSHHGFCCTSPVSACLAILRIAMSTHCLCFTIACGLLTSRVLPLCFLLTRIRSHG